MELHHPSKFKRGTRVLMCVARKKDTGENKTYSKMVTYSQKEFDEKLILADTQIYPTRKETLNV